jgi:O-methyltransferase
VTNSKAAVDDDPRTLYLELVKRSLTCSLYEGTDGTPWFPPPAGLRREVKRKLLRLLIPNDVRLTRAVPNEEREKGMDWPALALTMVGAKRLDNIQECIETVLREEVPGDVIETGVWRGGSVILMRAILKAHGVTDRTVWVADSFKGLPKPDGERYPADAGDTLWKAASLTVPLAQVETNFERYGLLDGQVRFLPGWFKDTLPAAPFDQLAVARLDGDMYESTMDALTALYPKLSAGGFLIIDDFALAGCRQAVHDFRAQSNIREEIISIDWTGVYWRKG